MVNSLSERPRRLKDLEGGTFQVPETSAFSDLKNRTVKIVEVEEHENGKNKLRLAVEVENPHWWKIEMAEYLIDLVSKEYGVPIKKSYTACTDRLIGGKALMLIEVNYEYV